MLLQCPFRNALIHKLSTLKEWFEKRKEVNVLEYSLSPLKQLVVSEPLGFIVKVVEQCLCFYVVFIEFVQQISF